LTFNPTNLALTIDANQPLACLRSHSLFPPPLSLCLFWRVRREGIKGYPTRMDKGRLLNCRKQNNESKVRQTTTTTTKNKVYRSNTTHHNSQYNYEPLYCIIIPAPCQSKIGGQPNVVKARLSLEVFSIFIPGIYPSVFQQI